MVIVMVRHHGIIHFFRKYNNFMSLDSNVPLFSMNENGNNIPTNSSGEVNTISKKNSEISSTTANGDYMNLNGNTH